MDNIDVDWGDEVDDDDEADGVAVGVGDGISISKACFSSLKQGLGDEGAISNNEGTDGAFVVCRGEAPGDVDGMFAGREASMGGGEAECSEEEAEAEEEAEVGRGISRS